ncbi:MAG: tRNA (adenosine(37)-N6)-threonylcarbamoyltransferase complex transferase subunit TsaD [Oscillospiraceae bacterium]|jgi:N6-L-threonylcarbamoyladenine synthase|nr:tRNA (adenosine(37)-N6)-threonylcarbamoyltransferase complex transferase subunit TsaD [Oscillospiraceae bacterium]
MNILAIESSCDETAAAVVANGRTVLSSVIASQVETHKIYGGVVPEIASRMHAEAICGVTQGALDEAALKLEDLDAIAVTNSPGLIGALLVGVNFAKGLALSKGLPLVPVHHLRGHIAANYIAYPQLEPPFLCLVVSGGHSHIIQAESYTKFKILGQTRDDAAGEAFDKAARSMGIPYPGGVHLDELAELGKDTAFTLPRPKVEGSPLDFSFSGLKTAVVNLIHNTKQKGGELPVNDICASFRRAVAEILTEKTLLAAEQTGATTVVLAGGVSANRRLRELMEQRCAERGLKLYFPPLNLCGDNAAMIASQGYYELLAGNTAQMNLNAYASKAIDA